jgi:Mg2+-importing ATPase
VPAQPAEPGGDRAADRLRRGRALLPFTPIAHALGFASLPFQFFLILVGLTAAYLILVEAVKARFYAHQDRPRAARPTHTERHHRHIRRRASRFARDGAVAA